MTFGEKLKLLRNEKCKTQEEVCKDIKNKYGKDAISLSSLKKYEGGGNPDLNKLKAISKYYMVSYDYLLNDECNTRDVNNLEIVNSLKVSEEAIEGIRNSSCKIFLDNLFTNTYRDSLLKRLEEKLEVRFVNNYCINRFCKKLSKAKQYIITDTSQNTMKRLIDYLEKKKIEQKYWDFITNDNDYKGFLKSIKHIEKSWESEIDINYDIEQMKYFNNKTFESITSILLDYEKFCDMQFSKIMDSFYDSYEENNAFKL